ncbi:MAG: hydroxymethylbilane synthase [Planctomycetales bacterium]
MSHADLPTRVRIATRSSRLALWQAEHVAALLRAAAPDCHVELIHVSTIGDRNLTGSLRTLGSFGVFTREVQNVVLNGDADLAVHSLKDLPTDEVPGLALSGVPAREETSDALILPLGSSATKDWKSLPQGARIGTGSLRRRAQLLHQRPDLQFLEVRGNVETRLRKLDEGEYEALILAEAGLRRLELAERISERLTPPLMYCAVGQGALGLECRADDSPLRKLLERITDRNVWTAVHAERSLLRSLRGGCHAPIGVQGITDGQKLSLTGVVLSPDGTSRLIASESGPDSEANALGVRVADDLRAQGADELINAAKNLPT